MSVTILIFLHKLLAIRIIHFNLDLITYYYFLDEEIENVCSELNIGLERIQNIKTENEYNFQYKIHVYLLLLNLAKTPIKNSRSKIALITSNYITEEILSIIMNNVSLSFENFVIFKNQIIKETNIMLNNKSLILRKVIEKCLTKYKKLCAEKLRNLKSFLAFEIVNIDDSYLCEFKKEGKDNKLRMFRFLFNFRKDIKCTISKLSSFFEAILN